MTVKIKEEYKLIEAASELRSANPNVYDKFVLALRERYVRTAEKCVMALPEFTPEFQGRARELKHQIDLLSDLSSLMQQVQTARSRKEIP